MESSQVPPLDGCRVAREGTFERLIIDGPGDLHRGREVAQHFQAIGYVVFGLAVDTDGSGAPRRFVLRVEREVANA